MRQNSTAGRLVLMAILALCLIGQGGTPAVAGGNGEWDRAGHEIGEAARAVGEAAADTADRARAGSEELWEKTRRSSAEAWDKARQASAAAVDEAGKSSAEAIGKAEERSKSLWRKAREKAKRTWEKAREAVRSMTGPDRETPPSRAQDPGPEKEYIRTPVRPAPASQGKGLVEHGHLDPGAGEQAGEDAHGLLLAVDQEGDLGIAGPGVPGEEFLLVAVG